MNNYYIKQTTWIPFVIFIAAIASIAPNIDPSKTLSFKYWEPQYFKIYMYALSSMLLIVLLFFSKYTYLCIFRKPIMSIEENKLVINGWKKSEIKSSKGNISIIEDHLGQYTLLDSKNNKKYYAHYKNLTKPNDFISDLEKLIKLD